MKKRALFARKYTAKAKATRQIIATNIRSTLPSIKNGPHRAGTRKEAQHKLKTQNSTLEILMGK